MGRAVVAKGRKRKEGKRTASGQLSRSKGERAKRGQHDVRSVALAQPHRAWLAENRRTDQRAESEIGRLCLGGRITEAQYWAGDRWARLIGEFHQVLATPMPTGSMLGRMVADPVRGDREGDVGAAERPETEEERRERVLVQHDGAMRALRRLGVDSRDVFAAMESIVIHGRPAGEQKDLDALRAGLTQLARLWRMEMPTEGRIRAECGERSRWQHEEKVLDIINV